jgi:hypothetical protein
MIGIFQTIMDWFTALASAALAILPDSPIATAVNGASFAGFETIMSNINYFVPIGAFMTILTAYVAAVLVYYGVRYVLRWAKYID